MHFYLRAFGGISVLSVVLDREKVIVLNLENIRQLIAHDQTIIFSVPDPRYAHITSA